MKKYIMFFIFIFSISYLFFNTYNISFNIPNISDIVFNNYKYKYHVTDILNIGYTAYKKKKTVKKVYSENREYLVYLYNTHDSEKYFDNAYSINPTVSVNNYIVKDYLEDKNIGVYVEESSVKDLLSVHGYKYSYSYLCSRELMENAKNRYNSLKYFVDIHRDSLDKNRTTVNVNNEEYASILFIVGLENKNYNSNLQFTDKINDLLNKEYPGISKGILKKSGRGVNGVYNQDFSPYTILIEIGGKDNTLREVIRSAMAFSKVFYEVIKDEEHI